MKKSERFSKQRYQELLAAVERGYEKRAIRVELEISNKGLTCIVTTSSSESDQAVGGIMAAQIQGFLASMYPGSPEQWEAMRAAPKQFLENLPDNVREAVVQAALAMGEPR